MISALDHRAFAFHFVGGSGVKAGDLGDFLRYVSTLSQSQGISLEVVGLDSGSLIVRLRTAVKKEFLRAPLAAMGAGVAIASILVDAFIPNQKPQPFVKVAINMVEKGSVEKIEIKTVAGTELLMDEATVEVFRQISKRETETDQFDAQRKGARFVQAPKIRQLVQDASEGTLIGETFTVDGRIHFRPAGFNFLVPARYSISRIRIVPGARYRVEGHISTVQGQPDEILITNASPL